ncbi:hypothetical protein ACFQMA_00425 [Halosimplex aquaticum]|uniref:DUF7344 domain-containing protein n=1 Tax=Halosimplex aquaticum TaxID=3026162 RepID=A0ABD5XXR4_9EURY|nr:hypothetical protein [Halosimplex aquaticum]
MTYEINSPPSDGQSIDAICELLADDRRRFAVSALAEREPPVALVDLARDVAARKAETDVRDVPADRVEEVAASLHHHHLPKLDDYGGIAYDAETKAVDVAEIESLSRHVPAAER